MDRRFFMRAALAMGCSAAAHPLLSTVTLAQGARRLGDKRLIVIILRGAMDGLDAVQPVADPLFAQYRRTLAADPGLDLDGYFALNPGLAGLMPLWTAGELAFAHATSTPYRDKRSHFDGQDLLEAGTGMDVPLGAVRDGWLNRMLQALPDVQGETAYALGAEAAPLLQGAAMVRNWSPDMKLILSAQGRLLLEHVYHDDDLFREAAEEAMAMTAVTTEATMLDTDDEGDAAAMKAAPATPRAVADVDALVDFAAGRLRAETRIAAFSLSGWDTHRNQRGGITASFARLERMILRMRIGLGPDWAQTVVLTMTEFGRTVAENGSRGTDHGTGGVMFMAGGAIRGGKVYGAWPGLAEADLYDRRDLMPTSDVRGWAAHLMRGLYGFDRDMLEKTVFPGLVMGDDPGVML